MGRTFKTNDDNYNSFRREPELRNRKRIRRAYKQLFYTKDDSTDAKVLYTKR